LSPFLEFVSTPLEKALAPLHCQLVDKIYTGPNASLYKCVDLNSGNFVAVKEFYTLDNSGFLSSDESDSTNSTSSSHASDYESSALKAALKEAEILKAVQGHPNVVQLITSAYEKPYFFLFTEFCNGGTLSSNKVLCRRSIGTVDSDLIWKARFKVCQQVKEVLVHIHELGIIHGDIKPSNVLFDEFGQVRVGDFGNSEYFPLHPLSMIPLCLEPTPKTIENFTIPYMAPELLKRPMATSASDMWAFGCFALEISTGVPPWYGLEPAEILLKLSELASPLNHAVERLDGVPTRFTEVIKACLCPDPTRRPTARQLLEAHYL
jgi:serine/threonine protein kinase